MYIVYSKDNCPGCVTAKEWLNRYQAEWVEKKLGVDFEAEELRQAGVRQLPYIVEMRRNVEYVVGGLRELQKELFNTGGD